jgi:hypothetical protein
VRGLVLARAVLYAHRDEMKRDLDKYQHDYAVSPFEETMAAIRRKEVISFLEKHQLRKILEVGCGNHSIFEDLGSFERFAVVEPGEQFFERAITARLRSSAAAKIFLHNCFFEDFAPDEDIDCIVISSLLHELPAPNTMLHHAWRIAPRGCWLHVNVPNAKSFHRLWAKEAGLIRSEYERSETDKQMQRNHLFDLESLRKAVVDAGFAVQESGSYFVKPFTHSQMQQLLDLGVLTSALLVGLGKMESHMPGLGAEIYVNARKNS